MHMIELQPLDIPLAVPLPWPMLAPDGQLLVPKGDVIHSSEEVDLLFTLHRPHRQTDETAAPAVDTTPFPNTAFPAMGEDAEGERAMALELLGLRPGGMLTVRLTAGAGQSKGTARIMGYSPQRHLLITVPVDNGRPLLPVKDELLEIHAFSGEGIGNAFYSARIAVAACAEAIGEGDTSAASLRRYEDRLWETLGDELKVSRHMQWIGRVRPLLNFVIHKAAHNEAIADHICGMLANAVPKKDMTSPLYYLKLLVS